MPEHLAWPVRLDGTGLATIDQDSDPDVAQCIHVLLATRRGVRVELPGFGVTDPTFSLAVNVGEIANAVAEWEPRAARVAVTDTIEDLDATVRRVLIERGA